ncbi:hypothetical protein PVIIG_05881 [Plasmodium vivax India VII]|uniref:Uncharacterized protein n=1 Tax=Plasmodium vivax India VII TaxID=1077284 RepID=A0A0J9S5B5_PLAVI|nr:hypothetical protein PVIIG_05881 [Plasmodium vivax India VII]
MDTFYTYVSKFPEIASIISKKNEVTNGIHYQNCDSFKNTNLISKSDDVHSILKTCAKIAHYIGDIIKDIEKNPEFSEDSFCKYIGFWFYDMLNSNRQSNYSTLLAKFFTEIISLNPCKSYQINLTADIYQELKNIYNIYDDFNKFKEQSTNGSDKTCTIGRTCVTIYEENVDSCINNYKNGFCWNLINFKYEYDNHKTKVKSCWNDMKYLKPIKTDLAAIISLSFVLMALISFILLYLYKVCNKKFLNIC